MARILHAARELSLRSAVEARLRHPGARLVPYRQARVRLDGDLRGGGRLEVGVRWPSGFFEPTEFILQPGGTCTVTETFAFYGGCSVVVDPGGRLSLGGGYLNQGGSIACFEEISIGRDVAIGPEVMIRDSDSHIIKGSARGSTAPIRIGDRVWVGARAMILKGVTIGDGAIVAAGAVVTKDVEAGTLVAGVPARYVRHATWEHEPG